MRKILHALGVAAATLSLAIVPLVSTAAPHGGGGGWGHGGGSWHGGAWHGHGGCCYYGGWSVSVGFGPWWYGGYPYYYPYYPYYYGYYPGYVVGTGYPVATGPAPQGNEPAQPSAPEPVIYPRNGQSAEQTEADRRDCDRWAMTQPRAMADANVFHRAALACMEGRGYTVR
jgi:hypothetical protein